MAMIQPVKQFISLLLQQFLITPKFFFGNSGQCTPWIVATKNGQYMVKVVNLNVSLWFKHFT